MNESLIEKKRELHKKANDSINNLCKYMVNIFNATKFNEVQLLEETNNLELLSSTMSISNELEELTKLVSQLKVDFLKKEEFNPKMKKSKQLEVDKEIANIHAKVSQLQELFNYVNSSLKEMKATKFYKYSLNLDD